MAPSPTLEAVLDAMQVAAMGGDVGRLSLVCRHQAEQCEGEDKERLIAAGTALAWANRILTALGTAEAMPGTDGIA